MLALTCKRRDSLTLMVNQVYLINSFPTIIKTNEMTAMKEMTKRDMESVHCIQVGVFP